MKLSMKMLPMLVSLMSATSGMGFIASAHADSQPIIIDNSGHTNSSLSNEYARQQREEWNDTKNLRGKVNRFNDQRFDKLERAYNSREACEQSFNDNAYWEPNTLRCLDRHTGRPIQP